MRMKNKNENMYKQEWHPKKRAHWNGTGTTLNS